MIEYNLGLLLSRLRGNADALPLYQLAVESEQIAYQLAP